MSFHRFPQLAGPLGKLCLCAAWCLGCANALDPVSGTLPAPAAPTAGGGLATVLDRIHDSEPESPPAPYVAAVVEEPSGTRRLRVYDATDGQLRFVSSFEPTTRPAVMGDLVVTSRGDALVALSATDGTERFVVDLPLPQLVAVAGDGAILVATVQDPSAEQTALVGLDRSSGQRLFEHRFPFLMGRPAVVSGVVALPLQGQTLSLLDGRSGALLAELRSEDDLITWAQRTDQGLRFGHRRVYMLRAGYDGTRDSLPSMQPPTEALPGSPFPFALASAPVPATRSAHGRVAAFFGPEKGAIEQPYGLFYRHVYRLRPGGSVRWAAKLPGDAVDAVPTAFGLLVLDEQGTLSELAEGTGERHVRLTLDAHVLSASMSAGKAWTSSAPAATGGGADSPGALRAALLSLAADDDTRLYPSRRFAIRSLLQTPDASLTGDLLALYADAGPLRPVLTDALSQLEDGNGSLMAELEQPRDALQPGRPAPIAAVAEVLAARGVQAAAPAMAARMLDYHTPLPEIPQLSAALLRLSPRIGRAAIETFLGRYRMDSSLAPYPEVWLQVAALWLAYSKTGDPPAALTRWAYADDTPKALRESLKERLEAVATAPHDRGAAHGEVTTGSQTAEASVEDELSPRLLPASVAATFAPQQERLRECLRETNRAEQQDFRQLRITMLVSGLGASQSRHYAPSLAALDACVDPIVHGLRFEVTRARRQVVNYVVRLPQEQDDSTVTEPTPRPWWAPYADLASPDKAHTLAPIAPWWRNRNRAMEPVQPGYASRPREAAPRATGPAPDPEAKPEPPSADPPVDAWWEPSP